MGYSSCEITASVCLLFNTVVCVGGAGQDGPAGLPRDPHATRRDAAQGGPLGGSGEGKRVHY